MTVGDLGAPSDLIVIGGGEHARVVMDAARSRPDAFRLIGFADPGPCAETVGRMGVLRLGGDAECIELARHRDVRFVSGLGNTGRADPRPRILAAYLEAGLAFASVVHAAAWVSDTARLEPGAVVLAGARVNTGATLGPHVVVNTGAIVEHDVSLGAFTMVGPGAAIGGGTSIGAGSYVGLGARVRDHVSLGARVVVGMGAVVVGPIEDDAMVVGVPARALARRRTEG